ncbi:hypothetical protein BCV70DRAFT_154018 [Testicularia cyperi]|uniref:TAO3-Transcriptional Activator of OCH1 n=1 Tax=Testicularia cyperi TaxID=1882483 RepID=A0A317XX70_9BASI|nr:hypothetical protein BCV70DRAFT_154018 [Testicularia cyperi]
MQVVIPDLDDKELFAPPRKHHSPAVSASGSSHFAGERPSPDELVPSSSQQLQNVIGSSRDNHSQYGNANAPNAEATAAGPFRGPALGWHGRSGSGTSDSSAGGYGGLGYRVPPSQSFATSNDAFSIGSGLHPPFGGQETSGFSFPNKKPSMSSLRSPLRSRYLDSDAHVSERLDAHLPSSSDAGDLTAGYRSGLSTPRPPTNGSHFVTQPPPSSPAYASPSNAAFYSRSRHERNDSLASSPSKAPSHSASGSRSSRYHHGQSASYHSDSHHSAGAASSSASSIAYPYGSGGGSSGWDLPPVPPLPFAGDSIYSDMPVTPGGHTNNTTFQMPRAMASTHSFDHSDLDSPRRPPLRQLRGADDEYGRPLLQHPDEADETSSGDQAQSGSASHHLQHQHRQPSFPSSALAVSLGNEGLGQLPPGIGSPDPQAPAEYALNILMSRFISIANAKVRRALESALDHDPAVLSALARNEEELYASLCDSLAHISRKSASAVVRSLFRWKSISVSNDVDADVVRRHLATAQSVQTPNAGTREVASYLNRRKELISMYLVARPLTEIVKALSRDSLGEAQAVDLEEQSFAMLLSCTREKDRDRILPKPVHHLRECCFESVSELIGEISRIRFVSVSDRFVEIMEQSTRAPASKTVEDLLVAAIQSLRHLRITVYPMELFEEGADFVEVLARHFASSHGSRVKTAFCEAFTQLMLPVAQSASAEVNHPTWIKAIDTIWPRMIAMAAKPRYWSVAHPLHVCLLAVSPEEKLAAAWYPCVEVGVAKLKDRVNRFVVLNAATRLLWAYAFRCHESHTNTQKKLESFFRIWFPPSRRTVQPPEASPEPFVMMVHYVLFRHFEFGKDLVLNFLCHSALGGTTLSLQPDILTGQRTTIGIRAVLLTLHAYVQGESPAFPKGVNFNRYEFDTLPEGCGDELPDGFKFPKPEIESAQAQLNDLISKIALLCDHQISDMTVFDSRTQLFSRTSSSASTTSERALLERDGYTWRLHHDANLMTAYLRENQSYCDLLRACFDAWPRCISSSISFSSVLAILLRAHFSADPDLSRASARALRRIALQRPGGSSAVVSGFMRWIFRMDTAFWEIHPKQVLLMPKIEQAVQLWMELLEIWLAELRAQSSSNSSSQQQTDSTAATASGQKGFEMERTSAWALIDEVEAYALFLLCSASRTLRSLAIHILRLVTALDDAFLSPSRRAAIESARERGEEEEPTRIINLLDLPCQQYLDVEDPHLSSHQLNHLAKWKSPDRLTALCSIAQSEREVEHALWSRALPSFLRMTLDRFPTTVAVFRSYITNRVLEMDHIAVYAADISNRAPTQTMTTMSKLQAAAAASTLHHSSSVASLREAAANASSSPAEYTLMAQHWRYYILALCTTTTSTEGSRGGVVGNHHRKLSEPETGERMIAARDLFQKLVPFLASDNEVFQEAVVFALGNINENHYVALLETMQSVSGTLTDDFKTRSVAKSGLRRNRRLDRLRTALANVLQLTSPHMDVGDHLRNAKVVAMIDTWIKETFTFLIDREIRQDWEFHRLRRYFCGVTEQFFNGLVKLGISETFFPFETRLRMFRVFRDWHSYSTMSEDGRNKLANLLSAAADQQRDDRAKEHAVKTLNYETRTLSFQAGCSMAALCQGAISMVGGPAPAPMAGSSLEAGSLLNWLTSLFSTSDDKNHSLARKALRSLLVYNDQNSTLISSAVNRCITEPDRVTGGRSFFVTLSEVVIEKEEFGMPLHTVFCLGLMKLSHPDSSIRRKSLSVLEAAARRFNEECTLAAFEVGVSSPLPAIYLRAQRDVSACLAQHFDGLKTAMLSEFTQRMPLIEGARRATTLGLIPEWLSGLELHILPPASEEGVDAGAGAIYRTHLNLSNLFCLTVNHGDEHTFEVQEIWGSLVAFSDESQNASAIVRFLIDQGLHFRSQEVVIYAKRVVSCFSHTEAGPSIFDELCGMIEPGGMIGVPGIAAAPLPDLDHRHLYKADLARLLPEPEANLTFSPGQLALFYVGEMTYERRDQLGPNLPTLLHAIFLHVDSRSSFVRDQVVELFEQMMRCAVSVSVAGQMQPEESIQAAAAAKAHVDALFARRTFASWSADTTEADYDARAKMPRNLLHTAKDTLALLQPFLPTFQQDWGSAALLWAASNPIRHMACRSFQTFRALGPEITPSMMVTILGRLADTVSDHKPEVHRFSLEVLYALSLVVQRCDDANQDFLAQTWWATLACLSTVNEEEFAESVNILESLVARLDVGSPDVIAFLVQRCPEGWEGDFGLLRILVSRGLRSSVTSAASFRLMSRLAKCADPALIDYDEKSRLGYLFMAALPWFLQVTEESFQNSASGATSGRSDGRGPTSAGNTTRMNKLPSNGVTSGAGLAPRSASGSVLSASETQMVLEMASDLATIAAGLEMRDLERVSTSIAKSRFRTKDDLVRQAVNCVRTHYLPEEGPEMAVLLLGVVLNRHEWMRAQAMQVLKIFFQVMDTRNHADFSNLGSELLMPLLRQLSSPLSSQALEVLDEPIVVHGGPAANQILRMSLQWGNVPLSGQMREHVSDASIFGPPQESGWAVADPQDMTTRTRINLQALVKMCERTLDIMPTGNNVNFVIDDAYDGTVEGDGGAYSLDEAPGVGGNAGDELPPSSLGDIVNQLHDLSSFFGDEPTSKSRQMSVMWRDSRLDRSGSMRSGLGRAPSNRLNPNIHGYSYGGGTTSLSGLRNLAYQRQASPNPTVVPDRATPTIEDSPDGKPKVSPARTLIASPARAGLASSSTSNSQVGSPSEMLATSRTAKGQDASDMPSSRSHAQIAKILARSASQDPTMTANSASAASKPVSGTQSNASPR